MRIAALLLLAAAPLAAQNSKSASHPASARSGSAHPGATRTACVTVPELAPAIPALPAGLPCPRALFTLTSLPPYKLDYISPLEPHDLAEALGLTASSVSLAYVDTKIGSGPLAAPAKWYTIHYTGYLTDGTKFDSSLDRNEPINVQIGHHQVIPGWDAGFAGMHIGGKRRLFIPFQLAYGAQGRPGIPGRAELVFDVELLAQSDTEPAPIPKPAPAPTTNPGATPPPSSTAPATPPPGSSAPATPPTQPKP